MAACWDVTRLTQHSAVSTRPGRPQSPGIPGIPGSSSAPGRAAAPGTHPVPRGSGMQRELGLLWKQKDVREPGVTQGHSSSKGRGRGGQAAPVAGLCHPRRLQESCPAAGRGVLAAPGPPALRISSSPRVLKLQIPIFASFGLNLLINGTFGRPLGVTLEEM